MRPTGKPLDFDRPRRHRHRLRRPLESINHFARNLLAVGAPLGRIPETSILASSPRERNKSSLAMGARQTPIKPEPASEP